MELENVFVKYYSANHMPGTRNMFVKYYSANHMPDPKKEWYILKHIGSFK